MCKQALTAAFGVAVVPRRAARVGGGGGVGAQAAAGAGPPHVTRRWDLPKVLYVSLFLYFII